MGEFAMAPRVAASRAPAAQGAAIPGPRGAEFARLSQRLQRREAGPMAQSGKTVQRKIFLGGKEVKEEAEIEEFLLARGVHYFHSYGSLALDLINDDEAGPERRFTGEKAPALARLIGGRWQSFEQPRHDEAPEAQEHIQRKLVEIAELFRAKVEGGAKASAEHRDWYKDFILNGLCFGFVRVFEQHPDWTASLWHALETWQIPHGLTVDETLDQLNRHIEDAMRFGDGMEKWNFLEPVLLAQEAWNHMNEQADDGSDDEDSASSGGDSSPSYREPPAFVGAVHGTASAHRSQTVGEKDWHVNEDQTGVERWQAVLEFIRQHVDEEGVYHIAISHEGHEMAVRYVRGGDGGERWVVVETSGMGIRPSASWAEVGQRIAPRLGEAETEFSVEIKRQTPV